MPYGPKRLLAPLKPCGPLRPSEPLRLFGQLWFQKPDSDHCCHPLLHRDVSPASTQRQFNVTTGSRWSFFSSPYLLQEAPLIPIPIVPASLTGHAESWVCFFLTIKQEFHLPSRPGATQRCGLRIPLLCEPLSRLVVP